MLDTDTHLNNKKSNNNKKNNNTKYDDLVINISHIPVYGLWNPDPGQSLFRAPSDPNMSGFSGMTKQPTLLIFIT